MRLSKILKIGAVMVLGASLGCGDDGTTVPDAGGEGGVADCTGQADGAACGESSICLAGACSATACGDGFVDVTAGEECEDDNTTAGDGCEPASCTFSCSEAADCDDGFACNGPEMCNEAAHRCQAGTPVVGDACMLEDGGDGVCAGGLCRPPGCGNGAPDGTEECDDGNEVNDDGCESDCTFSCTMDEECADSDVCTGTETCDTVTHSCVAGEALDCDDTEVCTEDSCDPLEGCVNTLIDVDGDGYAAATCTTGLMGDDCNDVNDRVYPGADELCDEADNDCDEKLDEDIVPVTCYSDRDGDGYPRETGGMSACNCVGGTIPARADGEFDCEDQIASVNPGQTRFYRTGYCPNNAPTCRARSFDYNCDRVATKQLTHTRFSGCTSLLCVGGWTGAVAECGVRASFTPCSGFGRLCTLRTATEQTQTCN